MLQQLLLLLLISTVAINYLITVDNDIADFSMNVI